MSIRILIDSSTDLPAEYKSRAVIVPLTISFGDEEFADGVTIDHETFYKRLVSDKALPKTSQATPAVFTEIYENAKLSGDEVIVITLSSELSGTYQSAVIASQVYDNVYVVDGKNATIGTGLLVIRAFQLMDSGMSAEDIARTITCEREKVRLIAAVDTLEYLKRGGRLSKTAAIAGGLLNIKPIIGIKNGALEVIAKARGSKQIVSLMRKEIEISGIDIERPFVLGYTGLDDTPVRKFIADTSDIWGRNEVEIPVTIVGSTVGTHAGPGAVACAYFEK